MIHWIILLIAMTAGAMMPIQAGINSTLGKELGAPFQAALVSFVGGVIMMILGCLLSRQHFPAISRLTQLPWHLLIGGFLGGVLVVTSIILAPKLGATVLISCLVAGQLICSVLLDHFGLVGFPVHSINLMRLLGIFMLFGGVILVRVF